MRYKNQFISNIDLIVVVLTGVSAEILLLEELSEDRFHYTKSIQRVVTWKAHNRACLILPLRKRYSSNFSRQLIHTSGSPSS